MPLRIFTPLLYNHASRQAPRPIPAVSPAFCFNPGPDLPTESYPWLPTTKKQSALVYALNVLLLFNVTVIIVMLAGTGSATDPAPKLSANDSADRTQVKLEPIASESSTHRQPPSNPSAPTDAQPVADVWLSDTTPIVVEPESIVQADSADEPGDVPAAPKPTPKPQQDDPPVTFFGIGLE